MKNIAGVPYEMLVIGKPGSREDAYNTGYLKPSDLNEHFIKASK